ncbi:MAG: SIS domain-containing protein [Polyangiales bacterium]
MSYPMALEGALKLKEISYVHAEGYAAGEMKHGPIALLDSEVPVIVILPDDEHFDRSLSNLQEANAREAICIAITNESKKKAVDIADEIIVVPPTHSLLTPFITLLPLQLLAYHVADHKGTDVDQPRNLAKVVTVE